MYISATHASNTDPVGIALDGFLIYRNLDENGNTLTQSDLDECGGRTGSGGDYRYHLQPTYPYTLGCFSGTLSSQQSANTRIQCNTLQTCASVTLYRSLLLLAVCLILARLLRL